MPEGIGYGSGTQVEDQKRQIGGGKKKRRMIEANLSGAGESLGTMFDKLRGGVSRALGKAKAAASPQTRHRAKTVNDRMDFMDEKKGGR
jgi:hypothetical protein